MGFPLFPEQASVGAVMVDELFFFVLAITFFFTALVFALLCLFSVKYRRRSEADCPKRITGSLRLELFWTIVPAIISVFIFVWGVKVYFYLVQPPVDATEIYVVGKQWMWKIQHPEGQREINQLHIPVGQPFKITATSEDVIHSFYVPAFRTKVDVLPNRYVNTWFEATKPGTYHLFCAEMCGVGHANMIGQVTVMAPADYQAWLDSNAEGSLALEGRKLFLKYQCIACHSANAQGRGPTLEGIYKKPIQLTDGRTVIADDTYLRESIYVPDSKVAAGFQPIMPAFQGRMDEDEIIAIIAFLKGLKAGETPDRIDSAAPPTLEGPGAIGGALPGGVIPGTAPGPTAPPATAPAPTTSAPAAPASAPAAAQPTTGTAPAPGAPATSEGSPK